jgi:CubicO group peptidase (beta-lactamase class C family)
MPDADLGDLPAAIDEWAAADRFHGVVRVDVAGATIERAAGLADRRHALPNTVDTRFALASGMKPFTALTVMSLVESGTLELAQPVRSVLGPDLPLIDDRVTVEHLLAHRSGIGDYFDESGERSIDDYAMTLPVHRLVAAEDYLPMLDGHPMAFAPDADFAYCNGGFVVLAIIVARVTGRPFHDVVVERVFRPAGMVRTEFLRSDDLPADAAIGYLHLDDDRTNVLHLPVVGGGDGGVYSTVGDIHLFWHAVTSGRVVSRSSWSAMTQPRSWDPDNELGTGSGCGSAPTTTRSGRRGTTPGRRIDRSTCRAPA